MSSVTPASRILFSTLDTLPFLDLLPPVSQSPWNMVLPPVSLGLDSFPPRPPVAPKKFLCSRESPGTAPEAPAWLRLDSGHSYFLFLFENRERWLPLPATSCLPPTFPRHPQRCSVFLSFLFLAHLRPLKMVCGFHFSPSGSLGLGPFQR